MTADTYSNTLGVLVMGTGNDNNIWGNNANSAVFQILEDAIANALTSTVTGGTLDLSGTPPPAAASQVRYAALIFNGTLVNNQIIQVPNLTKFWFVQNATAGAFTLKLQTPAAVVSTAIPQNSGWQIVYCDGANGIVVQPFNTKQIQMPDGSASAPAYSDINETNSGWYRHGTQDWRLAINGVDVLQVTGPGAASPSVVNVLSPNVLQLAGGQIIPSGAEQSGAFIQLPSGGWLWEDGAAYSRPIASGGSVDTYKNLFNAITASVTGDTHTSTLIDNVSVDLTAKGCVNAKIEGSGIQSGTTITAITSTSFTLSLPTTGSASGVALTIFPSGNGDAATTFNVPDRRDRTLVGRGDMGGTNAGRMTVNNATALNTAGGEETHTLTSPESATHTHVATDSGHTHSIPTVVTHSQGTGNTSPDSWATSGTAPATTASSTANVTNANSGGGGAHNNMQPFGITNYIIKI